MNIQNCQFRSYAPVKQKISAHSSKNISFTNLQKTQLTQQDYDKAEEYLKQRIKELKVVNEKRGGKYILAENFDLDKLNGLQYGIELFGPHGNYDGMTMREIAYAINNLSIMLNRGCRNQCSHCYINAQIPSKLKNQGFTTSFTWEGWNF